MAKNSSRRPRLFVGSSTDSVDFAYAIQKNLESCAEVTVWDQDIFQLTKSAVESLIRALDRSDFAVFVFAPSDVVHLGQKKHSAVRDNVIFELGLFMGKLGRSRCFVVRPRGNRSLRIPTDLTGLTMGAFDSRRTDKNLKAAMGPFCTDVRREIRRFGPKAGRQMQRAFGETTRQSSKNQARGHTSAKSSLPSGVEGDTVVLELPRAPFFGGQRADFLERELARGCTGFKLRLALPKDSYWRAGFVLAPEDYIREGRVDIEIARYFLFHVGQGDARNPAKRTDLHYQAYYHGAALISPTPLDSTMGESIELNVGLGGATECRVAVIGSTGWSTTIDRNYTRYLYALAWADGLAPFRVPIKLSIH